MSRSPELPAAVLRPCEKRFGRWKRLVSSRRLGGKSVASFTSRVHRARFDVAVQDSNSYIFNVPLPDRPTEEDLSLSLFVPRLETDARSRRETNQQILKELPPDLASALRGLGQAIEDASNAWRLGDSALSGDQSAEKGAGFRVRHARHYRLLSEVCPRPSHGQSLWPTIRLTMRLSESPMPS